MLTVDNVNEIADGLPHEFIVPGTAEDAAEFAGGKPTQLVVVSTIPTEGGAPAPDAGLVEILDFVTMPLSQALDHHEIGSTEPFNGMDTSKPVTIIRFVWVAPVPMPEAAA